ncbi:MAG: pyridoxal phosphate-dependent aminotransferase [Polyangia bacterium]
MPHISSRLSRIRPSPTLVVTQKAQELRSRGVDVISFSAGEPDFSTPQHIVDAAKRALDEGMTRYTPVAGIPALREAVARQSSSVRSAPCSAENVIVTVGAKHALYELFQAILEPADVVIVPAPYWVSYPDQVHLARGVPRVVETRVEDGFALSAESLRESSCERTRAVVINSPCNPSGACYSPEAMRSVVRTALDLNLWIVADEIYRDLIYDGVGHVSPLSIATELGDSEKVFVVDGVSKTFAMTGWRIGWGIGHPEVIKAMSKIQGQSTSNPTAMAQSAAVTAISEPMDFLEEWREEYVRRRFAVVEGLERMPGVHCLRPQGAFYALPDVSELLPRLGVGATDVDFAGWLLDEARVATVPGSAFGAPGHIRLSYATSTEAIREGLARMEKAIRGL